MDEGEEDSNRVVVLLVNVKVFLKTAQSSLGTANVLCQIAQGIEEQAVLHWIKPCNHMKHNG